MATLNAKYYYKEHTYVAKNYTKIKTANGWVDGIIYQRENEPNGPLYVRGLEQFNERFTPYVLSEGDEVVVVTMGKLQAVLTVKSIEDGIATCEGNGMTLAVKTDVAVENGGVLEVTGWKPQASDVCYHTHAIRIKEARDHAEVEIAQAMETIKDVLSKMDEASTIQVSNILSTLSNNIKRMYDNTGNAVHD